MFTDELKRDVWDSIRQHDMRPLAGLMPDSLPAEAAAEAGVEVRPGPLNVVTLAWLAVLSAIERGRNFAGVLTLTLKLLHDAGRWDAVARTPSPALGPAARRKTRARGDHGRKAASRRGKRDRAKHDRAKHDPRGADPNLVSEEAFVQARRRLLGAGGGGGGSGVGFFLALVLLLGRCFERRHGRLLRWRGGGGANFRLLALDGTTLNLPGRRRLADHFGTAANGGGPALRTPQARLVMLQFPLTRLPWRYELTPLAQHERVVAGRLLGHLEPDDLVLMDRGFFSYGLFWRVQDRGAFFAVRLRAQVSPKHVRRLGYKDRLVTWSPADRRKIWADLPASIALRIVDYQIPGFRPGAVVTNVLEPGRVSRADWVRLATGADAGRRLDPGLYHRRWEIETTFLEMKVRQGMEGGLRGRTPACIEYEVAGHVVLYLLVRWLMVEAAAAADGECPGSGAGSGAGAPPEPLRLSFCQALRELCDLRPTILCCGKEGRVSRVLLPLLLRRVASHRVPYRPGRHDPRPGDTAVRDKGGGYSRQPHKLRPDEA